MEGGKRQMRQCRRQLRLVLIGKTGVGKSKTGNTILKNKNNFRSSVQGSSVTALCKLRDDIVFGERIAVVDTPGLFDTRVDKEHVLAEIPRCICMSSPGPNAFLLLIKISHFTEEDSETIKIFQKKFGDSLFNYVVIVFTHFDDWKRDKEDQGDTVDGIDDFIETLPRHIRYLINVNCRGRVVAFDNTLKGVESAVQVKKLLSAVHLVRKANEVDHYSNDDYLLAEKNIQIKIQEEYEKLKKTTQERQRKNASRNKKGL